MFHTWIIAFSAPSWAVCIIWTNWRWYHWYWDHSIRPESRISYTHLAAQTSSACVRGRSTRHCWHNAVCLPWKSRRCGGNWCCQGMDLFLPPATKLGKVMFLQASVILLTGGVCLSACWDTILPPPGSRPPRSRPPGTRHPLPGSRPPLGADPPPGAEHAGRYGQCAGGTHPTLLECNLVGICNLFPKIIFQCSATNLELRFDFYTSRHFYPL